MCVPLDLLLLDTVLPEDEVGRDTVFAVVEQRNHSVRSKNPRQLRRNAFQAWAG